MRISSIKRYFQDMVVYESYTYRSWENENNQNQTSDQVTNYNFKIEDRPNHFVYNQNNTLTYDASNTKITGVTGITNWDYAYDEYGQLIEEFNENHLIRIVYIYDDNGNLVNKKEYLDFRANPSFITGINLTETPIYDLILLSENTYTYEGFNLLTNDGTYTISYNDNGYPTEYGFYNGGTLLSGKELVWNDNNLTEYKEFVIGSGGERNYTNVILYTYNADGVRQSKRVNNKEYTYLTMGSTLYGMIWREGSIEYTMYFLYNENNQVVGCLLKDSHMLNTYDYYLYERDIFGNITGIYNSSYQKICNYDYTAYGEVDFTIGNGATTKDTLVCINNPFRYRGYIYDEETGLYWLSSRYYDPEIGRFISPDSVDYLDPTSINGLNLYAYCNNDPVNYCDPSGHFPILACILGITALIGMGLTIGGVATDNNLMTGIGLTMVAAPALISGGMAVACFGAWGTMAIGTGTIFAGIFSGLFASAEYQEAFTGNNWMIDAGMSEEWYNGLMIATASLATLGTCASALSAYNYHCFGNQYWKGGWREMRHHYWKHGLSEMKYSNVYSYTNGARSIISNGTYVVEKNAYAIYVGGRKVAFVGVGQGSTLITTFSYRTLTITKLALYGLL